MRPVSRFRRTLVLAVLVSGLVAATGASPAASRPIVRDLEPTAVSLPSTIRSYPAFDAARQPTQDVSWRVVRGTGNCCENYVTTTRDGWIVDFGGTYPYFSTDGGVRWQVVRPPTPLLSGEGAVAVAPGGDIVSVGWDPYSGDHLQAFKYTAATKKWQYAEAPLHTPFYDREWISVVPGPVTVNGETVPYATIIRGGWPSKDVLYYSSDGLRYLAAGAKQLGSMAGNVASGPLDTAADAEADYWGSISVSRLLPLGNGRVFGGTDYLTLPASVDRCPTRLWVSDAQMNWACYTPPGDRVEWQATDSLGHLHAVTWAVSGTLTYLRSADGGRTVERLPVPLPSGYDVTSPSFVDLKVNAAAGVVAIAVHARHGESSTFQDMVIRLLLPGDGHPLRLDRTLFVGNGDLVSGAGVTSSGPRFDFTSLAILPDGRVVVSFNDKLHPRPALAIEQPAGEVAATVAGDAAEPTPLLPPHPLWFAR